MATQIEVREREKVREQEGGGGEKAEGEKWGKIRRKRTTLASLPVIAIVTTKG